MKMQLGLLGLGVLVACSGGRDLDDDVVRDGGPRRRDAGSNRDGGGARDAGEIRDGGAVRDGGTVQRPRVVSTSPTEGAVDVNPALTEIVVEFDTPMDSARAGTTVLITSGVGGILQQAAITWNSEGLVATLSVQLEPDSAVQITLDDFASETGQALDGAPVLIDGSLDFRTGP